MPFWRGWHGSSYRARASCHPVPSPVFVGEDDLSKYRSLKAQSRGTVCVQQVPMRIGWTKGSTMPTATRSGAVPARGRPLGSAACVADLETRIARRDGDNAYRVLVIRVDCAEMRPVILVLFVSFL